MGTIVDTSKKMAGVMKRATGLTGLNVAKTPHKTLTVLYDKILRTLEKMPENAAYRKHTELIIQDRLGAIKVEPTVAGLEKRINCGQVEEVIVQAEKELSLARKMIMWKPWEPLIEEAPQNQWKWPA